MTHAAETLHANVHSALLDVEGLAVLRALSEHAADGRALPWQSLCRHAGIREHADCEAAMRRLAEQGLVRLVIDEWNPSRPVACALTEKGRAMTRRS